MPEKFADNSNLMQLGFGITFPDLYERDGLIRLDRAFVAYLTQADRALSDKLAAARVQPPAGTAQSELLIALAPHVEDFIAKLFRIEREAQALAERHNELAPLYSVKRQFVQRRALHKVKPAELRSRQGQFLYADGGSYTFMDTATYDQFTLSRELVGPPTVLFCVIDYVPGKGTQRVVRADLLLRYLR